MVTGDALTRVMLRRLSYADYLRYGVGALYINEYSRPGWDVVRFQPRSGLLVGFIPYETHKTSVLGCVDPGAV